MFPQYFYSDGFISLQAVPPPKRDQTDVGLDGNPFCWALMVSAGDQELWEPLALLRVALGPGEWGLAWQCHPAVGREGVGCKDARLAVPGAATRKQQLCEGKT